MHMGPWGGCCAHSTLQRRQNVAKCLAQAALHASQCTEAATTTCAKPAACSCIASSAAAVRSRTPLPLQPVWRSVVTTRDGRIDTSAFMAVYRGNPDGDDTYERRLLEDTRRVEALVNREVFAAENAIAPSGQARARCPSCTAVARLAGSCARTA